MARISKAELIRIQKKLRSDAAIGDLYGITRQAVHQLRKKYGIQSDNARNVERNRKIAAGYMSGQSGTALARRFGLSTSHTYRILKSVETGAHPEAGVAGHSGKAAVRKKK